jgi:hypothetical protein
LHELIFIFICKKRVKTNLKLQNFKSFAMFLFHNCFHLICYFYLFATSQKSVFVSLRVVSGQFGPSEEKKKFFFCFDFFSFQVRRGSVINHLICPINNSKIKFILLSQLLRAAVSDEFSRGSRHKFGRKYSKVDSLWNFFNKACLNGNCSLHQK